MSLKTEGATNLRSRIRSCVDGGGSGVSDEKLCNRLLLLESGWWY